MVELNRRAFGLLCSCVGIVLAERLAWSAPVDGEANNKVYRAAVLGHTGRGNYGHGMENVWRDVTRAELVAIADADERGLAKQTRKLGVKGFADYRDLLEQERPEIVAVAPRWLDQHRDMVVACAAAGVKGIYLEKPMCRSLDEADEMVAACERSGTKLAIATQARYSPQVKIIKQAIDQGKLGRIIEIRARGKDDRRGGGEDLWVLGTHVLDLMRHFGGDAKTCSATVFENGKRATKADVTNGAEGIGPLTGDEIHATFHLTGGAIGTFDSVRNAAGTPSRFGIRIFGTLGVIELYDTGSLPFTRYLPASSWSTGRSGEAWIPVTSAGFGEPETISASGLHEGNVMAVEGLIAAIETNKQPVTNIEEARKTVEMIASVFESHRLNTPVTLPLKNRQNPLTMLP